ncbi:hypothetical protein LWI29_015609 [Acer saccharum]|uniref:Uncharacterized protein n=1 Tax=Acer saccharum TaxID=4024 RepID=A0AA39W6D3_ACESA|nr:hypothetical protein LWI29_015609 [Acer saccharum]
MYLRQRKTRLAKCYLPLEDSEKHKVEYDIDIDLELFEITYVQCGDVEVEKKINEKIEQFIIWVEKGLQIRWLAW